MGLSKLFLPLSLFSLALNLSEQFASIEKMQVKQVNNVLTLDIIVDKSSVEIFANNGANVLTDLVFPRNETSSFQIKWKK